MTETSWIRGFVVAGIAGVVLPRAAVAQDDKPEFEYGDRKELEEVGGVAWTAQAQGSVIHTSGNSQTTTVSGAANASRKAGDNKFQAEASAAYASAEILTANDANGNGTIDDGSEIVRREETTSQAWSVTARYDRFFVGKNSVFVAGLVSADEPAGKELVGGGQLGYSRLLLDREGHQLSAEAGYDFSYESYVAGDSVSIHSGRVFVGYTGEFTEGTSGAASVEALTNANELDTPTGDVDRFEDLRVGGKVSVTTELFEDINFRAGFTARYDNAPAPRPTLAIPYADGFVPEADELDTRTEMTLIIDLL